MTELKPCPFCGGKAVLVTEKDILFNVIDFYIECTNCFVRTPYRPCEEETTEDWNRRVDSEKNIDWKVAYDNLLNDYIKLKEVTE